MKELKSHDLFSRLTSKETITGEIARRRLRTQIFDILKRYTRQSKEFIQ